MRRLLATWLLLCAALYGAALCLPARSQMIGEGVWKSVAAATSPTWDPSNKGASIALTNSNLTATQTANSGTNFSVRSTTSHSTGKYYFELSNITTGSASSTVPFGFATSSAAITSSGYQLGVTDNFSWGVAGTGATYYQAGVFSSTGPAVNTAGGNMNVAVDVGNQILWFRQGGASPGNWNNNGSADPATNTGGIQLTPTLSGAWFIAMSGFDVNDTTTLVLAGGSFANTPPSGFGNW